MLIPIEIKTSFLQKKVSPVDLEVSHKTHLSVKAYLLTLKKNFY